MTEEQLTAARCAEIVVVLRHAAETLGLRLHPASDMALMIREMGWLGSFPAGSPQPETAVSEDKQRALEAFILVEQASRMAGAWRWGLGLPGVGRGAAAVRSRLNRLRTQEGPALDFLFELDIAAKLSRRGLDVEFAEPDVVVSLPPAPPFGLACKRPLTSAGVAAAVRKGAHQINRSGKTGVVVIGLEAVFHRSGDNARPVITHVADSRAELVAGARLQLEQVMALNRRSAAQAVANGAVAGVLFCGVMTGWIKQPSANIFQWVWDVIENPHAPGLARTIGELLFPGAQPERKE